MICSLGTRTYIREITGYRKAYSRQEKKHQKNSNKKKGLGNLFGNGQSLFGVNCQQDGERQKKRGNNRKRETCPCPHASAAQ